MKHILFLLLLSLSLTVKAQSHTVVGADTIITTKPLLLVGSALIPVNQDSARYSRYLIEKRGMIASELTIDKKTVFLQPLKGVDGRYSHNYKAFIIIRGKKGWTKRYL